MEITPDLTPERFARLVDGGELPTACLIRTDDAGHRVTTECPNPACEDGLVWPDEGGER